MEAMVTEIASTARMVTHPAGIVAGLGAGVALMSGAVGRMVLRAQDLLAPRTTDSKEG